MTPPKPKGLGRGLEALLAAEQPVSTAPQDLPIDRLQPGKYQPRTHMDPQSLSELAASIKAQGLIQPITVRPVANGQYEIIAGERRWRAARQAGLGEVPVRIRDIPDESALAMSLIENIQREELNPLEEAAGVQRLIDEFGMTHEAAADAIGRSRSATSNLLRLLKLAKPAQDLLMAGEIDMGHARALLPLAKPEQARLAALAATQGLSVRTVEQLATQAQAPTPAARNTTNKTTDPDVLRLQNALSDTLGAAVTISANQKGAGSMTIRFSSLEALEGILARLSPENTSTLL